MLRELREPSAHVPIANFRLTLAGRGRNVRPCRFADASDSERRLRERNGRTCGPATERTSGGPSGRRPSGRCTDRQVGRRAPARAARRIGAGGKAPRRSELRTQRRLLGAFSASALAHRVRPASATCHGRLCTVRSVRDALLDDLDPHQHDAVTSTPRRSRSSRPRVRARRAVLTRRIAYRAATGAADARHVLAVTFTRKAAGELVSRHRPARRRRAASPPARSTRSRSAQLRRHATERNREAPHGPRPQGADRSGRSSASAAAASRSRSPTSRPRSSGPRPA